MTKYYVTRRAAADLLAIRRYLSEQSLSAADLVGRAFESAFQQLADSPNLGHCRLDLASDAHRFYLVHSYYIVYRVRGRTLRVVRVLHASRDVGAILDG